MKRITRHLLVLAGALLSAPLAYGQCDELFFSEYIEGSSNNKALEIYNPTGSTVDLSNYVIERFNNGGTSPSGTYIFPGGTMLMADSVYITGNSSAAQDILDESDTTHSITFYNGDDALLLINTLTGDTVDAIGEVGVDPGSSWMVGAGATSNFTLVRMASVQEGTTDWTVGATQWEVLAIDVFDSLGAHTMVPCMVAPPSGVGPCQNLYFSEYIEGSSSNKALEIYNPTAASVDLTDYVIYRANNGSTSPTDSIFPQGMIAAGDVYVIGNAGGIAGILNESDTTHSLSFYNGDDAIVMVQISTGDTLDVVGEVGVDPGSGWTVGTGATNNTTLIRMISVQQGTTDWTIGQTQWDVYPIDMLDSLGAHTQLACGAGPVDPTVFFTTSAQTVGENAGTVTIMVGINNENANPTSVDLVVNGASSAADPADYSFTSSTTVTFPANDNTPQMVTLSIVDDMMQEPSEDIIVDLMNTTNSANIGSSVHTVTITDNDAPAPGNTGSCSDLFFSEYVEGSSNNKAIEIYNPTPGDIDLAGYSVQRFTNGSASASGTYTWPAGSIIAAGSTYVIANASADPLVLAVADTTNAATFYNGDDAVVLMNMMSGDTLDIIGQVGIDPGTNWTVGSGATSEYTLVRMVNVQDGTTDWNLSMTQWEVFPQNTWDSLGTHTMNSCFSGPVLSFDAAASTYDESAGTVQLQVNIANEDANPTAVDIVINAASTATDPADYTLSATTVTFPGGSNTPQTIDVTIDDDMLAEGLEDIIFELANPTNSGSFWMDSIHVMTIIDNDVSSLEFDTTSIVVNEAAGTVTVDVNILNPSPGATSVDVVLNAGASTATDPADFSYTTPTTVTFPGGSAASQSVTLTIVDDMVQESTESLQLELTNPTNSAVLGLDSVTTVTILDDDFTYYTVAQVHGEDGSGVADSIGVECGLRGIVYGVNMRGGGGLQFTLIDQTGGIGTFSAADDYGYTVTEGDSIEVRGTIGQFNGLTQMSLDTVIFFTSNNPLKTPTVVTALDETTESDLVQINDVWLVDVAQWTGAGSGFNVDITDGVNTYAMRIDADVDVYNLPAPTGHFNLCGLGGQFDSSTPHDEGYQILPRYNADIKIIVDLGPDTTVCGDVELDAGWADVVWNTSATTQTINVTTDGTYYVDATYGSVTASDTVVVTVLPGLDLQTSLSSSMGSQAGTVCWNWGETADFTATGTGITTYDWDFGDGNSSTMQNPSHLYSADGVYTITLTVSNGQCTEVETFTVEANTCVGVPEFEAGAINVYPTLTDGNITLETNLEVATDLTLNLVDLQGRVVKTEQVVGAQATRKNFNWSALSSGIYLLHVQSETQTTTVKLILR